MIGPWYGCFRIVHGEHWATRAQIDMMAAVLTLDCRSLSQTAYKTKEEMKEKKKTRHESNTVRNPASACTFVHLYMCK